MLMRPCGIDRALLCQLITYTDIQVAMPNRQLGRWIWSSGDKSQPETAVIDVDVVRAPPRVPWLPSSLFWEPHSPLLQRVLLLTPSTCLFSSEKYFAPTGRKLEMPGNLLPPRTALNQWLTHVQGGGQRDRMTAQLPHLRKTLRPNWNPRGSG